MERPVVADRLLLSAFLVAKVLGEEALDATLTVPPPGGTVDVIHETREAGIYRLNVAPGRSIPLHVHRRMQESEMVITAGLLDLPAGFHYRALSTARTGTTSDARFSHSLSDGEPVPCRHDGMGAFVGPAGLTVLVRNHEVGLADLPGVDPRRTRRYDPASGGGTTTLWIDAERKLVRSFATLSGTLRNCAGGVTPWGTWLTCEECTYLPGETDPVNHDRTPLVTKRHGYVFEVFPDGIRAPEIIRDMGVFKHEAAATVAEDVELERDSWD